MPRIRRRGHKKREHIDLLQIALCEPTRTGGAGLPAEAIKAWRDHLRSFHADRELGEFDAGREKLLRKPHD
jgi:hypothetical protein